MMLKKNTRQFMRLLYASGRVEEYAMKGMTQETKDRFKQLYQAGTIKQITYGERK